MTDVADSAQMHVFGQKDAEDAGDSAAETGGGDADAIVVIAGSGAVDDTADEQDDSDEKQKERTP